MGNKRVQSLVKGVIWCVVLLFEGMLWAHEDCARVFSGEVRDNISIDQQISGLVARANVLKQKLISQEGTVSERSGIKRFNKDVGSFLRVPLRLGVLKEVPRSEVGFEVEGINGLLSSLSYQWFQIDMSLFVRSMKNLRDRRRIEHHPLADYLISINDYLGDLIRDGSVRVFLDPLDIVPDNRFAMRVVGDRLVIGLKAFLLPKEVFSASLSGYRVLLIENIKRLNHEENGLQLSNIQYSTKPNEGFLTLAHLIGFMRIYYALIQTPNGRQWLQSPEQAMLLKKLRAYLFDLEKLPKLLKLIVTVNLQTAEEGKERFLGDGYTYVLHILEDTNQKVFAFELRQPVALESETGKEEHTVWYLIVSVPSGVDAISEQGVFTFGNIVRTLENVVQVVASSLNQWGSSSFRQ
ncbi:MAG: hypothetical protein NZ480_05585 [Bdellovibrionaceae bacterium]|nr:hypothetical protein [Pseudobdellovibrionaceae bacterium]MDW8190507.1 hypothetical protein [Pseudobdellovibrionaceae bacterium]